MEINYHDLIPSVQNEKPDILILDKQRNVLDVATIEYNENHQIVSIICSDESVHSPEDVTIITQFLEVPGIGFIPPGVAVYLGDNRYSLNYGWHVNSSGQNLCSWFLIPMGPEKLQVSTKYDSLCLPKISIRTLSKEMIDMISCCECC